MYTEQDYQDICAQLKRRWTALLIPSLLLLAGVAVSFAFRKKEITMALTALLGIAFIFCFFMFLSPVMAYCRHLDEVLHGKTRRTEGAFKEMEEKPVWREGVSYYPMTLNVGNMEEPGDDRLFYFDANLTRPDWQPGERIAVTAHDKAVGAWEKL